MKLLVAVAALVLAAMLPEAALAQCNGSCTRFVKATGEPAGYGCIAVEGSGRSCVATTSRCTLTLCANAFLSTPDGRVVGELPCADEAVDTERLAQIADGKRQRLLTRLVEPVRIAHARLLPSPAAD